MYDVLEIGLEDPQLMAEIDLVTELMIAASAAAGPLDQRTIDTILGVTRTIPEQRQPA